jgi:hypothetical protein
VLFPAARRVLPEGNPLTLQIETDHQQVDELMARLDRSSSTDPEHHAVLERTFAVLDDDVRTGEDELLPRLQELLGPRRLRTHDRHTARPPTACSPPRPGASSNFGVLRRGERPGTSR